MNCLKHIRIRPRNCYAIHSGEHLGNFWVVVDKDKDGINVIVLPDIIKLKIDWPKWEFGVKHKCIKKVKRIPRKIFETLKIQCTKI